MRTMVKVNKMLTLAPSLANRLAPPWGVMAEEGAVGQFPETEASCQSTLIATRGVARLQLAEAKGVVDGAEAATAITVAISSRLSHTVASQRLTAGVAAAPATSDVVRVTSDAVR